MDRLHLETCTVDIVRRVARGADGLVRLSPMEAKLIAYLAERPGVTVSREELLREVWGYREGVVSRTLDTTIRTLRTKIEADRTTPSHVMTDPGGGYRFEASRAPPSTLPAPPPLPAMAAVQEPNQFVGRANEIAQLQAWFIGGHRLVTATGAAGVGKTRLARRAVRALLSQGTFPGGIRVVDLMSAETADDALHAIAIAMQPEGAPRLTSEAVGASLVSMGRGLLALDNVDQVVEPLAGLVSTWLDRAPELRVLITSRERLRLRIEQCLAVEPLPTDDATALLRARAAAGGIQLDAESEECIEALARRLEGLPLALELAAARIPALGPRGVLDRLAHGFSFLGDESRDLPVRHTSLHRAIQASWDLLPSWARDAWMQLSVFVGGFDLPAAVAVVDLSRYSNAPATDAVVNMLAERCLIRRTATSSMRFTTFESLRSFAKKRLDLAERRQAVELRHAQYYLAVAEAQGAVTDAFADLGWYTLAMRPQPRMEAERSNLLTAWTALALRGSADQAARLAVAMWTGALTMPLDTRVELAEQLRPRFDQMSKLSRCRMQLLLASLRLCAGRDEAAGPDLDRALTLATELSESGLRAKALMLRARAHRNSARMDESIRDAEAALALVDEAHDPARRAIALTELGLSRLDAANTQFSANLASGAEDAFTRAIALFRRARSDVGQGWSLACLGCLLARQERMDEARVCVDDAVRLAQPIAGTPLFDEIVLMRGYVAAAEGDEATAQASLQHASDAAGPMQARRVAHAASTTLAQLLLVGEDAHPALVELERADTLLEGNLMPRERAVGSLLRGAAECFAGRPTSAVASLVGCEASTGADPRVADSALGVSAWAHLALGRPAMARAAAAEVRARTTRGSAEERLVALIDATAMWLASAAGLPRDDARRKLGQLLAAVNTERPSVLAPPEVSLWVVRTLIDRLQRVRPS